MITKEQVLNAQTTWGNGVVKIGSLKDSRAECETFTSNFLDEPYSLRMDLFSSNPPNALQNNSEQVRPKQSHTSSPVMIALAMKTRDLPYNHGQKFVLKIQA